MWDEALEELQRGRWSAELRKRELYYKAFIYVCSGRYEDVLKLSRTHIGASKEIGVPLALAYAKLGDHNKAVLLAEEAVQAKQADAELVMGKIYAEFGDYNRALQWYDRAAQRFNRIPVLRSMGRLWMETENYREAHYALEKAIFFAPFMRVKDMNLLAECLRKLGRTAEAEKAEQIAREKE